MKLAFAPEYFALRRFMTPFEDKIHVMQVLQGFHKELERFQYMCRLVEKRNDQTKEMFHEWADAHME